MNESIKCHNLTLIPVDQIKVRDDQSHYNISSGDHECLHKGLYQYISLCKVKLKGKITMDIRSEIMAMYTIVIKKFTKECPHLNLMRKAQSQGITS